MGRKASEWVYAWTNLPDTGRCGPPVPPQFYCPSCGSPVSAGETCAECHGGQVPVRVVRKPHTRQRVVNPSPRMRRRARSFRGLLLLLVGLVIGLVLPRPWHTTSAPAPAPTPIAAKPTPAPVSTTTPVPASRIVSADAPPQDPWSPVAAAPRPTPKASPTKPLPTPKASPTPAREAGFTLYTVKPGDTFSTIASRVYGRASMAKRLSEANPEINPRALPLGKAIRVPTARVSPAPQKTPPPARRSPTPPPSLSPVAPRKPRVAP